MKQTRRPPTTAIVIINNHTGRKYEDRVKKIERALNNEGISDVVIWHFSEIRNKRLPDHLEAIILSGSTAHLAKEDVYVQFAAEVDLLMNATVPVLGICFGHQLIGRAFGACIGQLTAAVSRFQDVKILEPNEILTSWKAGDVIQVCQSHQDFVEDTFPDSPG